MNRRIEPEYIDTTLGFPVRLTDVPFRESVVGWVPDIDRKEFKRHVLETLAFKMGPLAEPELNFIRLHFEMTLREFSVHYSTDDELKKWLQERLANKPTEKKSHMLVPKYDSDIDCLEVILTGALNFAKRVTDALEVFVLESDGETIVGFRLEGASLNLADLKLIHGLQGSNRVNED